MATDPRFINHTGNCRGSPSPSLRKILAYRKSERAGNYITRNKSRPRAAWH